MEGVQVGVRYRGAGLGKQLAAQIFRLGQARGLKQMAAMMTPDQAGAVHVSREPAGAHGLDTQQRRRIG